ncbi:hypothetical protein ACQ4PT_054514 [Festuca glaucescens]
MGYLPPAISNTVGTSCIVIADVTLKALDADDVTFRVASFEVINTPAPAAAAVGGTSSLPTSSQQSAQLCTPAPAAAVGGTSSLPTSSEQSAQLESPEDPQACSKKPRCYTNQRHHWIKRSRIRRGYKHHDNKQTKVRSIS